MKPTATIRHALAAAVLAALPTLAFAQGQVDTSRSNDASNRVGSGGRNANYSNPTNNNSVINGGNRIVTGNVTNGREFRGPVGYSDPTAFRGQTAGSISDQFSKNSSGVPIGNAPPPVPNQTTSFYGASQTVAPPPGYQLTPNREGYMPTPGVQNRAVNDPRLGVLLNQPLTPTPLPGEMMTIGTLNPQQAAQQLGVLLASPLYGIREWNPRDPADRAFLDAALNRQNGGQMFDNRAIQKMRDELEQADPQNKGNGNDAKPTGPASDALTLNPLGSPLGKTFDTPGDPTVGSKPLNDQLAGQGAGAGTTTGQGSRLNVIGAARRTSTQYTELSKRLEQFQVNRPKTDADRAREFNADLKDKQAAEAKAAEAQKLKLAGGGEAKPVTPPVKPDGANADDPAKPKGKRPAPVKITTLAEGIRGEGLGNVMKKAESLMKEGKYASALDQYDQAEAVTPNNPFVWLGRGNAELGAGFFSRADAHLRQAMMTDKALLMGQYDLTAMLGEERLGKLVAELKEIANKENKPAPLFLLAYIAYNTGHERQALGYLDLAEKRAGNDPSGFYKAVREHWSLPDDATNKQPPAEGGAATPKPEQNK